jgi:hypothetical protein
MARAHALTADEVGENQLGWILAHQVRDRDGKRLFRKGMTLDSEALSRWADAERGEVHLIEPEPGDLHEDEAGRRVAAAVSGDGVWSKGPFQSRYHLISERKGLLRVDPDVLRRVNSVAGVTVFTLLDRQPVLPGKVVAGVKVTPLTIPEASIAEVEAIVSTASHAPLVVLPFAPKRVAVLATEGLNEKLRSRFREVVEKKMGWYGSEVTDVRFISSDRDEIAATMQAFLDDGVDIVMAAGGNTIDPLDPILLALTDIEAEMVHFGGPSHPGSMFWIAQVGEIPVINLATCSMYSRSTVADLILPLVMTGQSVTSADIVEIGYGGLLEREMAFRFPDYDAESSDEGEHAAEE